MRKGIIIGGIIFIAAIVGVFIAADQLNRRIVNFTLQDSGYTVEITQKNNTVGKLTNSSSLRLKDGDYSYHITTEGFDTTKTDFTVKGSDVSITIIPQLSAEQLRTVLDTERTAILDVLRTAYPGTQVTFTSLQLYKKGEWAAGTLQKIITPRQIPDTYRFVLEKKNNTWSIVIPARIAIKKTDFPNVPADIIYSLYRSASN